MSGTDSHTANETPRTDALVDEQIARARQGAGSGSQDYEELEDFARQIERELAEVRAALAGEDYASLPSDFPTVRMAHDIRSERDKFFWQVRDTCARAEKAEAALSETRRTESTLAPIRKGADPNLTTENAARIRATYEALLREVLDKSESGLTIDEGLHSRIEDAMEPKTEQPVAAAPCVARPTQSNTAWLKSIADYMEQLENFDDAKRLRALADELYDHAAHFEKSRKEDLISLGGEGPK